MQNKRQTQHYSRLISSSHLSNIRLPVGERGVSGPSSGSPIPFPPDRSDAGFRSSGPEVFFLCMSCFRSRGASPIRVASVRSQVRPTGGLV